jgi:hypothetical protein
MIGPGQHVFAVLQIAQPLAHGQRVGQFLARMGDGLHVDHRHRGVAGESLDHPVLAVFRPVLELRERAHGDEIDVAAQHARHFGDVFLGLAIHHLAGREGDRPGILAGREHHRVSAELERAELEAGARAHRRVEEQQGDRLAGHLPPERRALESRRLVEQRVDLGTAVILRGQEMARWHVALTFGKFGNEWMRIRKMQGSNERTRHAGRVLCRRDR